MKIAGVYFSGTGNTQWVAQKLEKKLRVQGHDVNMLSIEDYTVSETAKICQEADIVGFLYPIYASDMPKVFQGYMEALVHHNMPRRIKAFCITSVAIYSGDGALVVKQYCHKMNLDLVWGYNVRMPCNFNTALPVLKVPSADKIRNMKSKADLKLDRIIKAIDEDHHKLEGSDILNTIMGSLQRKSSKSMMQKYDVKINSELCIKCGKCVKLCPTNNLILPDNGKAVQTHEKCTACLRCVNQCPVYAIRMMNANKDKPFKQYKGPGKY